MVIHIKLLVTQRIKQLITIIKEDIFRKMARETAVTFYLDNKTSKTLSSGSVDNMVCYSVHEYR